ncbi:MAG TPA: restriction endonuclease subunit S [Staphylococcus ureilyticus]|uniref:restriction endonuclease subunit S n=1 Tax=Staphylococcus ureilyticus TaxID=94138 RepID=UPI001D1FBD99|nr:restriction endonuclease subunit S [Staphylococcus ureilyticus]HJG67184.1 restriction endonuclease subunit S [Staphylococcus ureilyticus]
MTKNDDKRVPVLRFKGFNDDWAQRKLENLTNRVKSYSISHDAEVNQITGTKCIHYGDIHTGKVTRIQNESILPNIHDNNFVPLKNGDVIVADASEDYKGIADACVIDLPYQSYKIVSGLHTIAFRPNKELKPDFLYTYLHTSTFKHYGYRMGTGLKVFGISYKNLANMLIKLPDTKEQDKINKVLSLITYRIKLQQRKLQQLKLLKKAMLRDLFADKAVPKLRFRGFKDYWVPKKLGDIAKFINGRAYKQNELLDKGKYKVLRVGNFYTNDSWYFSNLELKPQYYINKGDLVYTWSATFGPHIWRGEKVIYHYHIWKINLSKSLNKKFVFYLLKADKAKLLSNTNGSTMIHITKRNMESKTVLIPNTIEQSQIRNSLDNVSNLITFQQEKIAEVKQIKQFLLQNMFI